MESYKEYPIRCKTCGSQIAAFADQFETLLQNLTDNDAITQIDRFQETQSLVGSLNRPLNERNVAEIALNRLGLTEWCCRISMLNPTIVTFNMENRPAIEGIIDVDAANDFNAHQESTSIPVFASCRGPMGTVQLGQAASVTPSAMSTPIATPSAMSTPIAATSGLASTTGTIALPSSSTAFGLRPMGGLTPLQPRIVTPLAPIQPLSMAGTMASIQPLSLTPGTLAPLTKSTPRPPTESPPTTLLPLLEGVKIGEVATETTLTPKTFQSPTYVGVPIINSSDHPMTTINVGAGAQVMVLPGRTFLAN